jgi:hypothetical protein
MRSRERINHLNPFHLVPACRFCLTPDVSNAQGTCQCNR